MLAATWVVLSVRIGEPLGPSPQQTGVKFASAKAVAHENVLVQVACALAAVVQDAPKRTVFSWALWPVERKKELLVTLVGQLYLTLVYVPVGDWI